MAYGRRLLARDGLLPTLERLLTYPNTPWIRAGWGPAVRAARRLSGTTRFEGLDGRPIGYGGPIGERTVEVPLARAFLAGRESLGPVLEIGNVMGHHAPLRHVVVDRYERAEGIRNLDVVDFRPDRPFPTVLSISTLEHVGFDEEPPEPAKFLRALRHLATECLAPGGSMFVTLPMGYNPEVDGAVLGRVPELGRITLYRRRGLRNLWSKVPAGGWPSPGEVPPYSYRRHRLALVAIARYDRPASSSTPQRSSR